MGQRAGVHAMPGSCAGDNTDRADDLAWSCLGFRYRRTCKHYRAYREAVALVAALDAVNLAWDTRRGGNVAVRASQKGI